MSAAYDCGCGNCPTPTVVLIPGSPGEAGVNTEAIPPGVVDPEGLVVGTPGQRYFNYVLATDWVKVTGTGVTGWQQL